LTCVPLAVLGQGRGQVSVDGGCAECAEVFAALVLTTVAFTGFRRRDVI
jgi:hypothetical protein